MKFLKLIKSSEEITDQEYSVLYYNETEGKLTLNVYDPTIWYYSNGSTYEQLVKGELDANTGHHGSWQTLTSVHIGKDVTSMDDAAFGGCSSLTSVTIPNSVTSIGNTAFGNCTSLTSVTIPNSVTSIVSQAFMNCSSLTSVTYKDTEYTSKSALATALTNGGVTVGTKVFDSTALTD